ncbi:TPA: hypothetical protein EYP37_08680 [Candidatus Poribacteria bacterium]|nr:hypothetical protein [Candidatus Poribacteria bacterium]
MKGFVLKAEGETTEICQMLMERGMLPSEESFWFAWNEVEILLPRKLNELNEIKGNWDLIRIFSEQIELRTFRLNGEIVNLILIEGESEDEIEIEGTELLEVCPNITNGNRIFWGERMRFSDGEARGVVTFPRVLDYGIQAPLEMALTAKVWNYMDELMRLKHVRYRSIQPAELGSIPAKPIGR